MEYFHRHSVGAGAGFVPEVSGGTVPLPVRSGEVGFAVVDGGRGRLVAEVGELFQNLEHLDHLLGLGGVAGVLVAGRGGHGDCKTGGVAF